MMQLMAYAVSQLKTNWLHIGIDVLHDFFTSIWRKTLDIHAHNSYRDWCGQCWPKPAHQALTWSAKKDFLSSFWMRRAILFCLVVSILPFIFTYDSQTVTQGQDYLFHPCIGSHQVIEFWFRWSACPCDAVLRYMSVPLLHCRLWYNRRNASLQNHFIIFHIETLVPSTNARSNTMSMSGHNFRHHRYKTWFYRHRWIFQPRTRKSSCCRWFQSMEHSPSSSPSARQSAEYPL